MRDRERGGLLDDPREGVEQHLLAAGAGHADVIEGGESLLEFRPVFQHDAILAALREDGGDQALAEGVVERGVDRGGGDAEPAGGLAVDDDAGLQPLVEQVVGDIGEQGGILEALQQLGASRFAAR